MIKFMNQEFNVVIMSIWGYFIENTKNLLKSFSFISIELILNFYIFDHRFFILKNLFEFWVFVKGEILDIYSKN